MSNKNTENGENAGGDKSLVWKELSKKKILETPVFTVNETDSLAPDGGHGSYIVLDARDWGTVIPVLGDDFLMVRQWRHGLGALSVEFPGGVIERGERPEDGARRELLEETGFSAGTLLHLGSFNPNPALFSNKFHVFMARDLVREKEQSLDSDEFVHCVRISQKEVFEKMGGPGYQHALMVAALELYRQFAV